MPGFKFLSFSIITAILFCLSATTDQEQESLKREQELKRKQVAVTLEQVKEQLGKLECKLNDLKNEKHQLFLQLKKVLNEDETRKRQRDSEIMAQALAAQSQSQSQPQPQPQPQYGSYQPQHGKRSGCRPLCVREDKT